jgi:hypothetical protein
MMDIDDATSVMAKGDYVETWDQVSNQNGYKNMRN